MASGEFVPLGVLPPPVGDRHLAGWGEDEMAGLVPLRPARPEVERVLGPFPARALRFYDLPVAPLLV